MLAQIRKARQEESGFTLIELLIVIVILGVLAGIVVFAVGGINDRGEAAACKADNKTVERGRGLLREERRVPATHADTAALADRRLPAVDSRAPWTRSRSTVDRRRHTARSPATVRLPCPSPT